MFFVSRDTTLERGKALHFTDMRCSWHMKNYCAVFLSAILLPGCSGSGSDSGSLADNQYANGFRLARLTNTLNYVSDERVTIIDYDYDFSTNEIVRTRSRLDEDDEPTVSRLEIDRAGRLIGGSYDYTFGSFLGGTQHYDIRYDAEGKVIEYAESQYNRFTFNYSDSSLDNVVHYLSSSVYTFELTYDAQGLRTSSTDAVTSVTTHFEYDRAGQLSHATDIDQFGKELFSYEFGYDLNGNHVSTLSYTPFGELFSTDEYSYEASQETVFNHGIMRQQIEPFEATNISFVR